MADVRRADARWRAGARSGRGPRARGVVGCVLAVAAVAGTGGCADQAGQDLCTQYTAVTTAVDGLRELAPTDAPDRVVARAELMKTQLDRIQAVSEGRYDTAISTLRTAVDDVEQDALAARSSAQATGVPLLTDSMDDVTVAFADLKESLDTQCADG